jgi:hypothetical protein
MNPHLALAAECSSSAMKSLLASLFGCALCACSMLSPDTVTQRIPGPPPSNYRQIIADGSMEFTSGTHIADEAVKGRNLTAAQLTEEARNLFISKWTGAEVSMLRQTRGPQPGDWMACLRASKSGRMTYIAIFLEGEKILDYRTAISYDRCEGENYEALPPKSPPPTKDEADQPKEKK